VKGRSGGVLEYWSTGVLEYWSTGVLEYWSIGVLECLGAGVLESAACYGMRIGSPSLVVGRQDC
jgi:hypothetical protein